MSRKVDFFTCVCEIKSLISQKVFDLTAIDASTISKDLIVPSRVIFNIHELIINNGINEYKAQLVA